VKQHLLERSFVEIHEKDAWSKTLEPGGKYFLTRSNTSGISLIAFAIGSKWEPGNPFAMIATHIDSPCLKLKPLSKRSSHGYSQIGVETYGGGLWHTWFDRDLGVAGRAFVRTSPTNIEGVNVRIDEPILRVPSVAVHLEHQNPFKFSVESQLLPIAGQTDAATPSESATQEQGEELKRIYGPFRYGIATADFRHDGSLINMVAKKLNVHPENLVDFDLSLYDTQKATIGGLNNEFIFSARIDNLMMSFCALKAFTNSLASDGALKEESSVRMLVMFDHEEIGSTGPIGAQSTFLPSTLQRISALRPKSLASTSSEPRSNDYSTAYNEALAKSFLISADMHQGTHPNYAGYHESNHRPHLNNGIVFSSTSRRFLAKNTPGMIMLLELICKLPDDEVPPTTQFWVAVNGGDCGSTVGPHLESRLGGRVIDLGNAALSEFGLYSRYSAWTLTNISFKVCIAFAKWLGHQT
jgi:aspartyl aminopeptidase